MTPSESILSTAATGIYNPTWPEPFHQAVRALGYVSYLIDRVKAHPSKPAIDFNVLYVSNGETRIDEHTIPLSVFDQADVGKAMQQHLAWSRLTKARQNVENLQKQMDQAIAERDQAQCGYNLEIAGMAHTLFEHTS